MSKPLYWIVWVNGAQHRFTRRAAARGFAMLRRACGDDVVIKAIGF